MTTLLLPEQLERLVKLTDPFLEGKASLEEVRAALARTRFSEEEMFWALRAQRRRRPDLDSLETLLRLSFLCFESNYVKNDVVFALFSDAAVSSTVDELEKLWDLLTRKSREMRAVIASDEKNKFINVLKLANELLKRLSTVQHNVLFGRIMMLLAESLPLAERSGVNAGGARNDENGVTFENETEFTGSTIGEYELYKTFWGLQRHFTGKRSGLGTVNVKNQHLILHVPTLANKDEWKSFKTACETVLKEFETVPLGKTGGDDERNGKAKTHGKFKRDGTSDDDDLAEVEDDDLEETDAHNGSMGGGGEDTSGYLAAGRLFRLQLTDRTFRRQFLTQLLFHLRSVEDVARHDATSAGMGGGLGTLLAVTSSLRQRAMKELERTSAAGKRDSVDRIERVIVDAVDVREARWEAWKDTKCEPFAKRAADNDGGGSVPSLSEKATTTSFPPLNLREFDFARSPDDGQSRMEKLVEPPFPTLEEYSARMVEALDPANCIEDEYHPRREMVYSWQGLRLASRSDLVLLLEARAGSFEAAVVKALKREPRDETFYDEMRNRAYGVKETAATATSSTSVVAGEMETGEETPRPPTSSSSSHTSGSSNPSPDPSSSPDDAVVEEENENDGGEEEEEDGTAHQDEAMNNGEEVEEVLLTPPLPSSTSDTREEEYERGDEEEEDVVERDTPAAEEDREGDEQEVGGEEIYMPSSKRARSEEEEEEEQ